MPAEVQALADQGMVLVPMASLAGLWAYLRAEAVFFTHGLYGSPRPCAAQADRQPVARRRAQGHPARPTRGRAIASTYVVGSTALFTDFKASAFERARRTTCWSPATRAPTSSGGRSTPERLARLGITGDFVVWMPTFRRPRAVGACGRVRRRGAPARTGTPSSARCSTGCGHAASSSWSSRTRSTPTERLWAGVVTVDDEDLVGRRREPLRPARRLAGLVTDYSSVWVDYLLLDRPMAFSVPDRDVVRPGALPADILDWVPGEVVDLDHRPFATFFADLDAAGVLGAGQRREVAARIGLNPSPTAADDLVTALAEAGVVGLRPDHLNHREVPRRGRPAAGATRRCGDGGTGAPAGGS